MSNFRLLYIGNYCFKTKDILGISRSEKYDNDKPHFIITIITKDRCCFHYRFESEDERNETFAFLKRELDFSEVPKLF